MHTLTLFGAMVLAALLAGKAAGLLRAPKVTGYLLAGLALGPSGLAVVSGTATAQMGLLSQLAIALILFDIGGEFDPATIERHGGRGLRVALVETAITGVLVFSLTMAAGASPAVAALLAALALETSPSATILVVKEFQAKGLVTSTLLAAVAADILIAVTAFHIVLVIAGLATLPAALWAVGGSILVGSAAGWLLGRIGQALPKDPELLLLGFGLLLLTRGASNTLGVSGMLAIFVAGAVTAGFGEVRARIFHILKPISGVLYALFFVLAGASLHLDLLPAVGVVGASYAAGRLAGKLLGGFAGAALHRRSMPRWKTLPLGLVSHAGVAIGLAMSLQRHAPDLLPTVQVIVLASVVVFELLGPVATKVCLSMAQEAGRSTDEFDLDVLDENGHPPVPEGGKST